MNKPLMLCTGALLALFAGCKKDLSPLEELPDATEQGLNTAGWLLEGKAWVPVRSTISTGTPVNGYWGKTKTGFSLGMSFRYFALNHDWSVGFSLPDIRRAGTFALTQDPAHLTPQRSPGYGQFYQREPWPGRNHYTGTDAPGELIITRFDTVQNIVSGTFTMSPREASTGEPVQITQGRFDLKFDHR